MRLGELVIDSLRRRDPARGRDAATAVLRGAIYLSGRTLPHPDADFSRVAVCFEADSPSAERIPRARGDERRPWFCFENAADAARLLAMPGETVTASIVIDRFTIHLGDSDGVDSCRLVRVVTLNPGPR
jgi:hypothetical protein